MVLDVQLNAEDKVFLKVNCAVESTFLFKIFLMDVKYESSRLD